MLQQADVKIAELELAKWFTTKMSVTTLDFKNHLRDKHPGFYWSQVWVSRFLYEQGLPFSDNGVFRTYYSPNNGFQTLKFEEKFEEVVSDLEANNLPITKKAIKKRLVTLGFTYGENYDKSQFNITFENSNLVPTGTFTTENHKIYVRVNNGQHYSNSKGSVVLIRDMHPKHIENSIRKKYPRIDPDVLFDQNSELFYLLQNYFLAPVRQTLSSI